MSDEPQGLAIEVVGLAQVAFFLAVIVPAYHWVARSRSESAVLRRSAAAGGVLLAMALLAGRLER